VINWGFRVRVRVRVCCRVWADKPLSVIAISLHRQDSHRCTDQGRSDGEVYRYIYPPSQKNQSTVQIFMWLLVVVFFSLTQDKFDIVPVCALAHHNLYPPPPNEIPGYAPGTDGSLLSDKLRYWL